MFIKNYLTKIQNKSILSLDVNSTKTRNLSRVNLSNAVMRCISPFVVSHRGAFSVSQNNQTQYVRSTTRKKTSSEKLANKRQIKTIKQIISNILEVVKEKFSILKFAENKAKKRDFTIQDLKLIQNLLEKNQGNFPNAWAEFYQITGTNFNTFNN